MSDYVQRTLRYTNDHGDPAQINDLDVLDWAEPIVVLGEPGMGKTWLMRRLAKERDWTFRSAASFVAHPSPASLVPTSRGLVIDGLDELSAAQESDPVYRVLGQLIKAGCPPFILSCRAADWRGAVARQDISQEYGAPPREMTLEPFSRERAIEFLVPMLGNERAADVIAYLETKAIPDLYGNPLTLHLFGEVAARGNGLPDTRAELLLRASEIMWNERNDRQDKSPLSLLDRETALKAAGAVSAAFVLTGAEAITLRPSSAGLPRTVSAVEIQSLPAGQEARTLVGSRLFSRIPDAEDQYKPIHRSVAEFLGARWISRSIKDDQARDRALAMMTFDEGVPASLRGIHAWLAQDARFANEVIATDPYGVLRYGDADGLSVDQGRQLLRELKALQETNPYFRAEDWGHHSAHGLTHIELLEDVREILLASATTYHLRTLLLGVIRGSTLALALTGELHRIVLNEGRAFSFGERYDAAQAIVDLRRDDLDWPAMIDRLKQMGDEDSTRLALELMDDLGFEKFDVHLVAHSILAHLGLLKGVAADVTEHQSIGTLSVIAQHLSDGRVAGVLDALAEYLSASDPGGDYRTRSELARIVVVLVKRQIEIEAPEPLTLLKWLRLAPSRSGQSPREDRDAIAAFVQKADDLRRAIQHHVIFVERDHNVWGRVWRLGDLNNALFPDADDIIHLLGLLVPRSNPSEVDVEIWHELATFARRSDGRSTEILDAARPFAAGNVELEGRVAELAKPLSPADWEVKEQKRRTREDRKRNEAWAQHRRDFANNITALRAGELNWSFAASQAYLALFHDTDAELPPPDRIGQWLGPELQEAALVGLDAVLTRHDLPTLQQIADSYAESRRWNFVYPMIAGVVERLRTGRGLDEVPIDLVTAVRIALHNEHLGDRIDENDVVRQLDMFLRRDPKVYERYARLLIEPSLERRQTHIAGLYGFVRTEADKKLACSLAIEWLRRFEDMPVGVELELIDVLDDSGANSELQEIGRHRAKRGYRDDQHRRNWLAVALMADFRATAAAIEAIGPADRDFLWHLRHRLRGDRTQDRPQRRTTPAAIGWILRQFRTLWPQQDRPSGITSGDTNPWDASTFIGLLVDRLATDPSTEATAELGVLAAEPVDGYTMSIRFAAEQQRRARREVNFQGVTLDRLKDVVESRPPKTTDDLLAIIRHALKRLQKELRGNDTDSVVKYWRDNGQPREENRCTDALIEDLQRLLPPYGIGRTPQADMPNNKIADIIYTIGNAALPIECKGQWNSKLWSAAGDQLDAFYLRDWRAQDRGIYLVYWFGPNVAANFRLKTAPSAAPQPATPNELRDRLIKCIAPTRRGSIVVEVLDLTR